MLYEYSPEMPIYFGFKFKTVVTQGYMSGGAGYVLSKEALTRFIVEALPNKTLCKQDATGAEDAEIGFCLEHVHVIAGDSRDEFGRGRFFADVPQSHVLPKIMDKGYWYWKNQFYPTETGLGCCSDNAISFHYVNPEMMYTLEYLIYHMHTYGDDKYSQKLPTKITMDEVVKRLKNATKATDDNMG